VIQNAANSNCGLYLIALAQAVGDQDRQRRAAAGTGARIESPWRDVVLVDGDDLPARVKAATNDAPIKLALDAVNGMATARLAACLANGGTVLVYGMLTGEPCMIPAEVAFMRDIRLEGFFTSRQFAKRTPEQIARSTPTSRNISATASSPPRSPGLSAGQSEGRRRPRRRRGADRHGKVILSMT